MTVTRTKIIGALTLAVAAVFVTACETTYKYDKKLLESEIVKKLSTVTKLDHAKCPKKEPLKKGHTFQCKAFTKDGDEYAVNIKFTDKKGTSEMELQKLNMENVRNAIADQAVAAKNPRPTVTCPNDIPIQKGNSFECEAKFDGDPDPLVIAVKQTDNEGNISFAAK